MINYKKIVIATLVKVLFMVLIIFIFNTYPLFKRLFNGDTPQWNEWVSKSFTPVNFLLFAIFAIYYFYKDVQLAKQALKQRN